MPVTQNTSQKATGTGATKTTTPSGSRTADTVTAANGTSKATAALKAAVAPKGTAPAKTTTAPPKSTRGNSSVEVDFRNNRVVFFEYQKGDLVEIIEEAAAKLGMSGKVIAAALRYVDLP